jgi:hypothetical protein
MRIISDRRERLNEEAPRSTAFMRRHTREAAACEASRD